jgi:hypothetical protein
MDQQKRKKNNITKPPNHKQQEKEKRRRSIPSPRLLQKHISQWALDRAEESFLASQTTRVQTRNQIGTIPIANLAFNDNLTNNE